jgi:hypothetical protein
MARGSGAGGGGGGAATHTGVEMLGGGGGMDARGKTIINKKYFVTDQGQLETAPIIQGYSATNISYTRINDAAYEQNVTYEAQSDLSGVGTTVWLQNGVKGTFEMFCSFESKPIELHPRIKQLAEDYGGYITYDGLAKWPPTYSPTSGGGLGSGNAITNPMFGVTRYKEPTLTLRHTYFSKQIPSTIWNVTGKTVTQLPAGIPIPPGDRNSSGNTVPRRWMMQAPAVNRQGEAWQVVQEYVLLDAKGVADGMYEVGTIPGTA